MKNDKRGILGLDTVKAVMLIILTLVVLAIVTFLVLGQLQTATDAVDNSGGSVVNETVDASVVGGSTLKCGISSCSELRNVVCSISKVLNDSIGTSIASPNYTISGCSISNASSAFSKANWNITYSYTYDQSYTTSTVGNTTSGATTFFSYVPTFFVLLAVVVLILIIAIVIVAVSRFGGSTASM